MQLRLPKILIPILATAALFLSGSTANAQSNSRTVTNLTDINDGTCGPTDCSLREAIEAANTFSGPDTIVFKAGLAGTIVLNSTLPQVQSELSVIGPTSSGITVSGNKTFPIFYVFTTGKLNVSNLSLRDAKGFQGGAFSNFGILTVQKCALLNNEAKYGGGIYAGYDPNGLIHTTIINCTITGNWSSPSMADG